jgi:hypothetical protein
VAPEDFLAVFGFILAEIELQMYGKFKEYIFKIGVFGAQMVRRNGQNCLVACVYKRAVVCSGKHIVGKGKPVFEMKQVAFFEDSGVVRESPFKKHRPEIAEIGVGYGAIGNQVIETSGEYKLRGGSGFAVFFFLLRSSLLSQPMEILFFL